MFFMQIWQNTTEYAATQGYVAISENLRWLLLSTASLVAASGTRTPAMNVKERRKIDYAPECKHWVVIICELGLLIK